jgi:muramoyltetrapeptide carboxypeptidase
VRSRPAADPRSSRRPVRRGAGILLPPPLEPGDRVAVVAPAYPARSAEALEAGIDVLGSWGLEVVRGRALSRRRGYFAGTDRERAEDLQRAIGDARTRAIFCARGGWGTSRLLDRLDLAPLARNPKLIVGYSDLTVLSAELLRRFGLVTLHGPFVSELARPEAYHLPSLQRALFTPEAPLRIDLPAGSRFSGPASRGGGAVEVEGRFFGGCLSLLAHLCGTGRLPDTRGAVVYFEEIAEEPYSIDRMLWQLKASGFFNGVAAVLVGEMLRCEPRAGSPSLTLPEVLRDHLGPLGVPVFTGLPAGHGDGKWSLPIGFTARISLRERRIVLSPGAARTGRG